MSATLPVKILLNPLARGAWFAEHVEVARAALELRHPDVDVAVETLGGMVFLGAQLAPEALPALARASWVHGLFEQTGDGLRVLEIDDGLRLPADLVWGAKYRGKTNEVMTQLAIEAALHHADVEGHAPKLLDPMAGRGTTLLWAARYGIEARGVEREAKALEDLQRHVKRQTKLHRLKHKRSQGHVGPKGRDGSGRFVQFGFGDRTLKLVAGDSRDVQGLLGGERFTLIVADLPYGVQHVGRGGTRNPIGTLAACAPGWAASLRPGGAMALIFNSLQPRRAELLEPFLAEGLVEQPFRGTHRMSESIVRELAVFTRPR